MQQLNEQHQPQSRLYQGRKKKQRGIALLEALVALIILAFGVMGLLWMHQQALTQ